MAAEVAKKAAPAAAPKKKSGKLLWIMIAVVVCGGGAGAWLVFKPKAEAAGTNGAPPKAVHAAAIYYKFDPPFVVNFGSEGSARYLQVTLEAMSRDAAVVEIMKANDPAIRNDLVLLLSGQQYATLMTPEGKEQLRAKTLQAIQHTVGAEGGDAKLVEAVYFTSFVIQ